LTDENIKKPRFNSGKFCHCNYLRSESPRPLSLAYPQIHLGKGAWLRYNPFTMSAFYLMLWFAAYGIEPDVVLSESIETQPGLQIGQNLLSTSSTILNPPPGAIGRDDTVVPSATFRAPASGRQSNFPAPGEDYFDTLTRARRRTNPSSMVRAQSPEQLVWVPVAPPPEPMGMTETIVYEFVEGMNPFTPISMRMLEGYYDPYGWQGSYGINGHQPWRLGWVTYNDITVLPFAPVTSGSTGEMKIVEWNSNIRISELIAPGVLFNGTGYFNARWWDGPSGVALPGQVDQISTDLELGFFNGGPWSGQVAFHPQIVDGYDQRLNRYAFNFDGRAIATYKASPEWSFVGGVAFWDRVNVLVVPHVGVIWAPDDRWELRLLYPKSRISYYVGHFHDTDVWLYGAFEYTAESWQANIGEPVQTYDRIQITDDRLSLGLRWDYGRYSFFVEGGYVFNRQAKFVGPTPDFDLGDIGMFRFGGRY
jgi:hypothetical protein